VRTRQILCSTPQSGGVTLSGGRRAGHATAQTATSIAIFRLTQRRSRSSQKRQFLFFLGVWGVLAFGWLCYFVVLCVLYVWYCVFCSLFLLPFSGGRRAGHCDCQTATQYSYFWVTRKERSVPSHKKRNVRFFCYRRVRRCGSGMLTIRSRGAPANSTSGLSGPAKIHYHYDRVVVGTGYESSGRRYPGRRLPPLDAVPGAGRRVRCYRVQRLATTYRDISTAKICHLDGRTIIQPRLGTTGRS